MKFAFGPLTGRGGSITSFAETQVLASQDAKSEAASQPLAEVLRACGAFEWVTISYLGWTLALLCLCHRNIPHAGRYFAIHSTIAVGIVWLARMAARSPNRAVQFLRHWFPLALYIFFFEELREWVHAIFPGWFDGWLIQFDCNFAGVHPAAWMARFANPVLNDFMQFSYMTYFLYLVILPAILYIQKKRSGVLDCDGLNGHRALFGVCDRNTISQSRALTLHWRRCILAPLTGGAFTTTIEFIERFGRVHGAAFPSAHVAGSMVALLAARRYNLGCSGSACHFFAACA